MKKTLQIGKMYKTPWKVAAYDVYFNDQVNLDDGAYVVLLEITKVRRGSFLNIDYYIFKILTGDGEVRYLECTQAGMDYWKRCQLS